MSESDVQDRPASRLGTRERLQLKAVADAVCAELGLDDGERKRRRAVEQRIRAAYLGGRREPLYLVSAGLQD